MLEKGVKSKILDVNLEILIYQQSKEIKFYFQDLNRLSILIR